MRTAMAFLKLDRFDAGPSSPAGLRWNGVGRFDGPAIREASGMVASRRHPGIFWVHNDSGNLPSLFAVKRDGTLVREYLVRVPNIDWEDIAIDDDGYLYVGDIGNNEGRLPIRAIHRFEEPDPSLEHKGPLMVEATTFYKFPASGRFDAEGPFLDAGSVIVVAKTFDRSEAELFAVPLSPHAAVAARGPTVQGPAAPVSRAGHWCGPLSGWPPVGGLCDRCGAGLPTRSRRLLDALEHGPIPGG